MEKKICYCGHPEERHQGNMLKPCLHCTCKDFFFSETATEETNMERALKKAVKKLNDNCLSDCKEEKCTNCGGLGYHPDVIGGDSECACCEGKGTCDLCQPKEEPTTPEKRKDTKCLY